MIKNGFPHGSFGPLPASLPLFPQQLFFSAVQLGHPSPSFCHGKKPDQTVVTGTGDLCLPTTALNQRWGGGAQHTPVIPVRNSIQEDLKLEASQTKRQLHKATFYLGWYILSRSPTDTLAWLCTHRHATVKNADSAASGRMRDMVAMMESGTAAPTSSLTRKLIGRAFYFFFHFYPLFINYALSISQTK